MAFFIDGLKYMPAHKWRMPNTPAAIGNRPSLKRSFPFGVNGAVNAIW